jgi:O-antigen/teichoic acid export membrane protein
MAIKATNTMLGLVLSLILARSLGPAGYGTYSFVLALIMVLAIPAQVGLPQLIVRETAKIQASEDWPLMRGLWRWGTRFAMVCSLVIVVAGYVFLSFGSFSLNENRAQTLAAGLLLVPLIALENLRGAALRGLRHVIIGQLPQSIVRPAFFITFLLIVLAFPLGLNVNASLAMGLNSLATVLAFGVGAWLLLRLRPAGVGADRSLRINATYWRKAMLPLSLTAGLQLINSQAGILLLGIYQTDEEVGIYRVVTQLSMLVAFGLLAVNQVVMPYFSRLFAQDDMRRLQLLVTNSARWGFSVAFPLAVLFMVFGGAILGSIFGDEFVSGQNALTVLSAGQLFSAAVGYGWTLLNMSGHESATSKVVALGALSNIGLGLVVIPLLGIVGAALSSSIAIILAKLLGRYVAQRSLGIETSILAPKHD